MQFDSKKAFFKVNKVKDKAERLAWLENKLSNLISNQEGRLNQQLENLRIYANSEDGYTIGDALRRLNFQRRGIKKVRMPHIYDITELKVSQMTRLKSDINVVPRHAEYDDRGTAKIAHLVIKNINEAQSFDQLMIDIHRYKYILGEAYLMIEWDDELGDLDPLYVEAKEAGVTEVKLLDGKKLDLKRPLKVGDVRYNVEYSWNILPEQTRSGKYCDAQYGFHISFVNECELYEDYPEAEGKATMSVAASSIDSVMRQRYPDLDVQVPVYHFYHKKTKYLPEGKYVKFIPGYILEETDLPYDHGDFPWERITDLDIPTNQEGVSRYIHVAPIQRRIDDLNYAIDKNDYLFSKTKYLMPRGSMKVEDLGNSNTVAQYAGPVPPSVLQVNPTPPQVYERVAGLIQTMQILMGTHGISRGEIPPGITANSALQFLNQLESERASSEIQKHADFVVRVCRKALSVASQRYKPDDGRIVRVVGKNNKFYVKNFDAADLSKPYDIKFENSDGFPETLAARRQRLQDMMHQNKDMMSGAQWMHHFGMSDEQGAIDAVTEAIKSAESENEDLMSGNEVMLPESFEDSLTHYRVHLHMFQKREFKEEASNEVMKAAKDHLFETEAQIIEKMQVNPNFAAQVAQLPMFPVFFHENYQPPKGPEHAAAVAGGQANRGEEITEIIPTPIKETIK